jgi:hypothetical protein
MDVESTRILTWHQTDHVSWSLGDRPNTKPGDHDTPNAYNRWRILLYHVWGPAWIEIHWNSICLRARSHMGSHYTSGSVTTLLHDLGGVLGRRPLDTFFWALIISWSRHWLLCEVALPLLSRPPVLGKSGGAHMKAVAGIYLTKACPNLLTWRWSRCAGK